MSQIEPMGFARTWMPGLAGWPGPFMPVCRFAFGPMVASAAPCGPVPGSSTDGTPGDAAHVARDAGLVQAGVHHADAGCADAHARCHADPRGSRAAIAGGSGLVDAGVPDTDSWRTHAGTRC